MIATSRELYEAEKSGELLRDGNDDYTVTTIQIAGGYYVTWLYIHYNRSIPSEQMTEPSDFGQAQKNHKLAIALAAHMGY